MAAYCSYVEWTKVQGETDRVQGGPRIDELATDGRVAVLRGEMQRRPCTVTNAELLVRVGTVAEQHCDTLGTSICGRHSQQCFARSSVLEVGADAVLLNKFRQQEVTVQLARLDGKSWRFASSNPRTVCRERILTMRVLDLQQ
jgi:hypothetical protein